MDTNSLELKIMRLKPLKSELEGVYEGDWAMEMIQLQEKHDKTCKHKK